jgi:hypothetical protein
LFLFPFILIFVLFDWISDFRSYLEYQVEVLVEIGKDYPIRPPIFKLKNIPKNKQKFPPTPSPALPSEFTLTRF